MAVGEQQQAAGTFRRRTFCRHDQELGRDAAREAARGAGAVGLALAGLHDAEEALGVDDLTGHLDVVPASAPDWRHDPFSGEIADGCVWGRGAIDMKDMDAMMLAVVRHWARTETTPPRDIVLAFIADEEAGGDYGSSWLVKNRPDLLAGCTEAELCASAHFFDMMYQVSHS